MLPKTEMAKYRPVSQYLTTYSCCHINAQVRILSLCTKNERLGNKVKTTIVT